MAAIRPVVGLRSNAEEIAAALQRGSRELRDLRPAMRELKERGEGYVKRRVPRRTGRLARSVRGVSRGTSLRIQVGGRGVPYAAVQEYGWKAHNIKPKRYVRRAYAQLARIAPGVIERHIAQQLRRVGVDNRRT